MTLFPGVAVITGAASGKYIIPSSTSLPLSDMKLCHFPDFTRCLVLAVKFGFLNTLVLCPLPVLPLPFSLSNLR